MRLVGGLERMWWAALDEREAINILIRLKNKSINIIFENIDINIALDMAINALADQELKKLSKIGGEQMDGT